MCTVRQRRSPEVQYESKKIEIKLDKCEEGNAYLEMFAMLIRRLVR
jgi:hypothetical protein